MTPREHRTPGPKIPEHLSTSKSRSTKEEKIDRQMEDTFPASDPPSYSGGNHMIGAPEERKSEAATGKTPAVKDAEKKVQSGQTGRSDKY
jgi:hypothetical protein